MSVILVAEPDSSYARRIVEILASAGWTARVIGGRQEAFAAAHDKRPALLIASATLPEAKTLLADFSRSHGGPGSVVMVPVAMAGAAKAADYQADMLLEKPFSEESLVSAVRRGLASQAEDAAPQMPEADPENQLTSEQIFGDVLAEVEAEARRASTRNPDAAQAAARRSRRRDDDDIERKLEETLSGVFPMGARSKKSAPRPAATSPVAPPPAAASPGPPASAVPPPTQAAPRTPPAVAPQVGAPPMAPAQTTPPAAPPAATPRPAAPRPAAPRRPVVEEDEINDLLDKTLSSLELPTRARRSTPRPASPPPAAAPPAQAPSPPPPSVPLSAPSVSPPSPPVSTPSTAAPVSPPPAAPSIPPAASPITPSPAALSPPAESSSSPPPPLPPIESPPAFEPPASEPLVSDPPPAFEPPPTFESAPAFEPSVEPPASEPPAASEPPPTFEISEAPPASSGLEPTFDAGETGGISELPPFQPSAAELEAGDFGSVMFDAPPSAPPLPVEETASAPPEPSFSALTSEPPATDQLPAVEDVSSWTAEPGDGESGAGSVGTPDPPAAPSETGTWGFDVSEDLFPASFGASEAPRPSPKNEPLEDSSQLLSALPPELDEPALETPVLAESSPPTFEALESATLDPPPAQPAASVDADLFPASFGGPEAFPAAEVSPPAEAFPPAEMPQTPVASPAPAASPPAASPPPSFSGDLSADLYPASFAGGEGWNPELPPEMQGDEPAARVGFETTRQPAVSLEDFEPPKAPKDEPFKTHRMMAIEDITAEPPAEGEAFGEYTLLDRVAVGGMAEVWRARRRGVEGFQKTVAIKRILSHLTDTPDFINMFIDEAKLAAQLSHNHIIQIYDLGKVAEDFFIAMEFVDGKDLRSILNRARKQDEPVPLHLALFIVAALARALDYAHRKKDFDNRAMGLVHRDVSPQNVLISYEGDIKLCDFGIVKAVAKASTTQMGALKGKLQYMSPEQAWGKTVDARSDIFSLGSVLFEVLTGERLFTGDSELNVLDAVRECRIRSPRELVPEVPAEIETIVLKALTQTPEERYQTAGEMERDLMAVLDELRPAPSQADLSAYVSRLFEHTGVHKNVVSSEPPPEVAIPEVVPDEVPADGAAPEGDIAAKAPPKAPEGSSRKGLLIALLILVVLALVAAGLFWMQRGQETGSPATSAPVAPTASPEVTPTSAEPEVEAGEEAESDSEESPTGEGDEAETSSSEQPLESEASEEPVDSAEETVEESEGGLDLNKLVEERVAKRKEELEEELKKQYEEERKRLEEELQKTREQEAAEPPPTEGGGA